MLLHVFHDAQVNGGPNREFKWHQITVNRHGQKAALDGTLVAVSYCNFKQLTVDRNNYFL